PLATGLPEDAQRAAPGRTQPSETVISGDTPIPPADVGAPRSFTVEHDGLTIANLDWGGASGARPVVLLHPNGFCAGLFDPIARRLAAGGAFRPVGIDLRGHGATDKPEPPDPYTYEAMAGDVIAVVDALGCDDVDTVGG